MTTKHFLLWRPYFIEFIVRHIVVGFDKTFESEQVETADVFISILRPIEQQINQSK